MLDQNAFMETIGAVGEIIKASETQLSEQEILSYFADMDLDDSQKKIVLEYLKHPKDDNTVEDEKVPTDDNKVEEENTSTDHSAVFQMYMDELSFLPVYSKEEETKMYTALLGGNTDVIRKISDAWLKRVIGIAEQYMAPKIHVEDLIQEGNMALFMKLQELCGLDEEVNVEELLEAAIEEGIMTYASQISGEQQLENAMLGKVNLVHEASKLLAEEIGREPTIDELSEYTKMSAEELTEIFTIIEDAKKQKN